MFHQIRKRTRAISPDVASRDRGWLGLGSHGGHRHAVAQDVFDGRLHIYPYAGKRGSGCGVEDWQRFGDLGFSS